MSNHSLYHRFIAIEGIDGSGKTTLSHGLAEVLEKAGYPCLLTCEPTDGIYGRKLRRALRGEIILSPERTADYFIADRKEHVKEVISEAAIDGKFIICDRYILSTVAYQGAQG